MEYFDEEEMSGDNDGKAVHTGAELSTIAVISNDKQEKYSDRREK
jgi:hypothetical protein